MCYYAQVLRIVSFIGSFGMTKRVGVCKYYIGPIGDLSLSTATAAA